MKYAILRLSKKENHLETFDLKFKLENNSFVCKWIDCVLEAQQKGYNISERDAIYNISDDINAEFYIKKLNRLINDIDKVQKIFGLQIKNKDDQDTLNKIHAIFEQHHGKLDTWKTNKLFENKDANFRNTFSEINQTIHALEGSGGSPKIRIVWFDLPKTKTFTNEDYDIFTNQRTFGSLYHLYCDVGKNIEDLTEDNDDHHHDVVPNLHYSADCVAYFCEDSNEQTEERVKAHKNYIIDNKNYLESKGYNISDKKLTTGRIEIGKLETNLTKEDFLSKIKEYNNIQSFILY